MNRKVNCRKCGLEQSFANLKCMKCTTRLRCPDE
ncbi:hypothetical protein HOV56_gp06 [Nitrosopumilus spindle-shaped virus]|uniref:Uncharacterized protein n=1 Tax=Nitrosopumilus spindle-shaped virus TaxID=2508184 RepID=A0A514K2N6_9VIRU|nr:hypothetical protein HOV56_gp06 [Nitrosopumilus spindle-shaped virus]YP_010772836.1 hypothetical protein QIT54_gp06 [Nitrosopumilus spindle-shaped virus]QDI73895.1 hypothetical protein [Nitrosopumilus spindle-shaped virus]QDI73944.1 hypothetical protein [Nitrosopumilus spindle-shaped virus]